MQIGKLASVFLAWLNVVIDKKKNSTYEESRLFIAQMRHKDFGFKSALKVMQARCHDARIYQMGVRAGASMLQRHLGLGWLQWIGVYEREVKHSLLTLYQ